MANLPNKSFVFNFNAKNYNPSTYTIPKESGATLDMDMVWTATTSTIRDNIQLVNDHLVIPESATSIFTFSSGSNNPLNYTSNNVNLTLVFKAKYSGTGTNRGTFIGVQDGSNLNWAVRIGSRENNHASDTRISHIVGTSNPNWDKALSYTCGDTITAYVRSQFSGSQIHTEIKDITNGQSATPFNSNYSGIGSSERFFFFNVPYFAGEFYWVYVSREVLTDDEIAQVVMYNDGGAIELDVDNISLPASGGTSGVTVTSENAWTTTKPDWVSISPNTGNAGETEVSVSAGVNRGKETRSGNVVFTDGEDSATLSVTQAGDTTAILKNLYRNGSEVRMMLRNGELIYRMLQKLVFEVDKDNISFEDIGGSTTITITANDKWTMTKPEWITASQTSGNSTATITLSVSASETQRTGDIVIACDGITKTISVEQGLDYSEVYLTIEALENGTFYIRASNVGYSINGGEWTNTAGETPLILSNGDKVRLKHSGSVGSSSQGQLANNTIRFKVYGNIMSYNWGDNFIGKTTWNGANYQFYNLFIGSTGLVDASKLILPVTNLIQYSLLCYGSMFYGCTSLRTAPELPSETPTDTCYTTMFYNCSNLNYIKCLATEFTGDMNNWVYGVSPTGTFVKKAGVTWPTGASGIPTNWTVEEVD